MPDADRPPPRIALWSGPRTLSTALMRSWGSRADTVVADEPLCAHYLDATGRAHPGRDEIIARYETDWRAVVDRLTGSIRRFPPDCLDPKIHHNNLLQSILAKIEANEAGADAALMLDRDGFIAEGHGTHVFLVDDGTVLTGPAHACPKGITRRTVLDLCARHDIPHAVRPLTVTEAYRADEMFCSGTMGELAGVTTLDRRTIGDGAIGSMTRRLSALHAEKTATEGYPIFASADAA